MKRRFELEPAALACRCCGATVDQHACGAERFLNAGQSLMRCGICGVAYLTPDFTDAALDTFYAQHYRRLFLFDAAKQHDEVFFKHTLYRESSAVRATLLAERLPANAHVLEIGSGFGGFIGQLFALRPDISFTAIEGDAANRHHLLDGASVTFIERDEVPNHGPYDAIVAFHVVEHMKQPVSDVHFFAQHLCTQGEMVIEVPNALSEWGGWSFVQPAHLSYFTSASLTRMLTRAQMQIVSLGEHPGGIGFEGALWAITQRHGETAGMLLPTTALENEQFAVHIARYRYGWRDMLRKMSKTIAVAFIGAARVGAWQRRKSYRRRHGLYPALTNRR